MIQRNLSGIYFRHKVGEKMDNVCFEYLPEEKQRELIEKMDEQYKANMILKLAQTIRYIGDQFDLMAE